MDDSEPAFTAGEYEEELRLALDWQSSPPTHTTAVAEARVEQGLAPVGQQHPRESPAHVNDFFAPDTLGFSSSDRSHIETAGPGRLTILGFVPKTTGSIRLTLYLCGALLLCVVGAWLAPVSALRVLCVVLVLGLALVSIVRVAAQFARQVVETRRVDGGDLEVEKRPLGGGELLETCRLPNAERTHTLGKLERTLGPHDDYSAMSMELLILVERWVARMLCADTPAVAAAAGRYRSRRCEIDLAAIAQREDKMTLGALAHWASGLEHAVLHDDACVVEFLQRRFEGAMPVFERRRLSKLLFALRERRNALAHGRAERWGHPAHRTICSLVLGQSSVAGWLQCAALTTPLETLLLKYRPVGGRAAES